MFLMLPGHTFDGPASKHPSGLPSPWEFAPGLSAEMGMHLSLDGEFQCYAVAWSWDHIEFCDKMSFRNKNTYFRDIER